MKWNLDEMSKERRKKLCSIIDHFIQTGHCDIKGLKSIENQIMIEESFKKCIIQKAKKVYLNYFENLKTETNQIEDEQKDFKSNFFIKRKNSDSNLKRSKSSYGKKFFLEVNQVKPFTSKFDKKNENFKLSKLKKHSKNFMKTKEIKNEIDITFKFEGLGISNQPRKVKIFQQIWKERSPVLIFQKYIFPKEKFKIKAKRCQPPVYFCFYILVDELKDAKINTCCSLKKRSGSKIGHFTLVSIEGGTFCGHSLKNKIFKKSDNVKANTKVKIKEDKLASKSNEDYEDEFENFENEDESKIKNIHY